MKKLTIFTNRNLVKSQIMTYAYGAGTALREREIQQLLMEELKDKGEIHHNNNDIMGLTRYISQYFSRWIEIQVKPL
jgi:hypothetical protein